MCSLFWNTPQPLKGLELWNFRNDEADAFESSTCVESFEAMRTRKDYGVRRRLAGEIRISKFHLYKIFLYDKDLDRENFDSLLIRKMAF